jgi:hypothetical protein
VPVVKNTRSSGLEMLKGRQIERTNNAAVESNCSTSQLRTPFCAMTGARGLQMNLVLPLDSSAALFVRSICRPLQGASLWVGGSQG